MSDQWISKVIVFHRRFWLLFPSACPRLGLDPKLLAKILNMSSGRCWSSDTYNPVPGVMEGVPSANNYQGGFGATLMAKVQNLHFSFFVSLFPVHYHLQCVRAAFVSLSINLLFIFWFAESLNIIMRNTYNMLPEPKVTSLDLLFFESKMQMYSVNKE